MAESAGRTVVSVDQVADATRHPRIDAAGSVFNARDGASHQPDRRIAGQTVLAGS